MATRSLAAAALSAALVASAAAADEYFTGDGTAYTLGSVSSGNCNFMSAIPTASTNYAALNNDQWDGLANCGRCAEVSCIDADCAVQNTTAIVQILDRCPECTQGALDLSPTVFKTITGSDPSRLTIQWKFVDCPSPGNVEICLKTGSNANWVAVQPTNFLNGVESVTINGASTSIIDGAYYFLYDTSEVDLSSVKVAITSMAGDTIEDTVSLTAGSCVTTSLQFSSTTSGSSTTTTTTTAPATTTSAPVATTTAPSTTTAAPTSSDEYDNTDDSTGDEYDSQAASTSGSSSTTTTAPATTTSAPVSTTAAPVATTSAPSSTDDETDDDASSAPSSTDDDETDNDATSAPTTSAPVSTTAAPSADTSKCRVRYRN